MVGRNLSVENQYPFTAEAQALMILSTHVSQIDSVFEPNPVRLGGPGFLVLTKGAFSGALSDDDVGHLDAFLSNRFYPACRIHDFLFRSRHRKSIFLRDLVC